MDAPSFWLDDVGPVARRPALDGSLRCDVAILGAGYTGLWTALELLRREPGLDIVVVEREHVGFGASGRNAGWCSPYLNIGVSGAIDRFGRERGIALQRAMLDTVDEVGRAVDAAGIDADYRKPGMLVVARGAAQLPAVDEAVAAYRDAGFGDLYRRLDADTLADRVRIAGAVAALHSPQCAQVHPARLALGLADAVETRGGRIVGSTTGTGVTPRDHATSPAVLHTDRGDVHADVVVLATEAYLTELSGLRRRLLPLYSLIVLTEPLDDGRWATIGWESGELVASERLGVEYLARTDDGRILFGGRGAPYRFASSIDPATERHASAHARLRRAARSWFPALDGAAFTHAWGGVLGAPRDGLPTATYRPASGLALGGGYTGGGVAGANLVGRILADLITGRETELTALPIVDHRLRPWPPEPLRWAGVRAVALAVRTVDGIGDRLDHPIPGRSLLHRLIHG